MADEELAKNKKPSPLTKKSGKKVAIIGAGPAGLAAAFYLNQYGHEVQIFEKGLKDGGDLLKIEEGILPAKVLDAEVQHILLSGVNVEYGKEITADRNNFV